jgi:long-chain acyl-CoA synthetase
MSSTGPLSATTVPTMLLARVAATPNRVALRYHRRGLWEEMSWSALLTETAHAGDALAGLGVLPGTVVVLLSRNRPQWIAADIAIQGLGASTLALHPDFSPETTARLIAEHHATVVIAGDQEQYDKIVEHSASLPTVQNLVVIDTRGVRHLDTNGTQIERLNVTSWASLLATPWASTWQAGVAVNGSDPDRAATIEVSVVRAADAAKTATVNTEQLSGAELIEQARALTERFCAHQGDELAPAESLSDPIERSLSEIMPIMVGAVINIGQSGEVDALERAAVQPTLAHLPASQLHAMHADMKTRIGKFGLRRFALNRIVNSTSTSTKSATSALDSIVTRFGLAGIPIAAMVIHRLFVTTNGAIRLAAIALLAVLILAVLIIGGFAVRPFVRKAYGLSRSRALLTSPDLEADTSHMLSALKLRPQFESAHGPETAQ